jgi:hypothetical protein
MDPLYPVLLFSLVGGIFIAIGANFVPPDERQWLVRTLLLALVVRMTAAAMFASIPETRMFHEDAAGYEYVARKLALSWKHEWPPINIESTMGQNYGWMYICGAIYYVFGDFRALVSCFNCVLGTMVVYFVYVLSRQFFHPLVARRAALLTTFVPSMVLWSSVAIKDTLMAFLILVGLLSCVSIKRRFSVRALFGICFSLLAMQPVRFYMIYFLGFAIATSLFLERGVGMVSGVYKQLIVIGSLVVLLGMVGIAGRAQSGLDALNLEHVSQFRHGMAITAKSGFDADADVSTPGRALLFLPLGVSELLLGPFPWQFNSVRGLMAAPETVYWWLLFPAMLRSLWWMFRKRFATTSPLILFSVTMTLAYSLVHGNVGSGFRQRAQIFVLLFIFASLGVYRRRCRAAKLDPDLLLVDHVAPPAVARVRAGRAAAT